MVCREKKSVEEAFPFSFVIMYQLEGNQWTRWTENGVRWRHRETGARCFGILCRLRRTGGFPVGQSAQHLHPQTSQTLRGFENSQCNDAANWLENYIWSKVSGLLCRGRIGWCEKWTRVVRRWAYEDSLYEDGVNVVELFLVWVHHCACAVTDMFSLFLGLQSMLTLAENWCILGILDTKTME